MNHGWVDETWPYIDAVDAVEVGRGCKPGKGVEGSKPVHLVHDSRVDRTPYTWRQQW